MENENVGKMHVTLRKGSIINIGLANEEKGIIEEFDCSVDEDICVYVENQPCPVTILNKTGESKL